MTDKNLSTISFALSFAEKGKPVFPCDRQKKPLTKHGFKDASTDSKIISDWWKKYPEALIGLVTGHVSDLFVLDVDLPKKDNPADGRESLALLESQYGKLPDTLEQQTGSGGRQLFFKMPDDVDIRNSASKIGPALDIRANGGYVIVPPSLHESGNRYHWVKRMQPVDAPQWLIDLCLDGGIKENFFPERSPVGTEEGRPGDDYNTRGDIRPILQAHGWTFNRQVGENERWCRPEKKGGNSATLFEDGSFYVFTPNAQPFEADKRYTPFAVYALLEHCGDYTAAAQVLAKEGYGQQEKASISKAANTEGKLNGPIVQLLRGNEVEPEPISWIWPGWLASGKTHIFGGAPGTGKTTISMSLAATVTTGGRWPDGSQSTIGNVAIWSGEDDPADTLIPRLNLSGADLSRVYFISGVVDGAQRRSFDPTSDLATLRQKLENIGGVSMLIVDPIVSAVAGDSHKNAEVRRSLQPLVDLAAEMRCVLLGITHFTKGTAGRDPVERITGSLAFGALARVVLVAAKQQKNEEDGRTVRLFLRAKSNIGQDTGGFEYDFRQDELKCHPGVYASIVQWGKAVKGTARDLLAIAEAVNTEREGSALAEAKKFLLDLLTDGPMPVKEIKMEADGAGHSWASVKRARRELGIKSVKEGGHFGPTKQQWIWNLPIETLKVLKNTEDAQYNMMSTFKEFGHLQQVDGFEEEEMVI